MVKVVFFSYCVKHNERMLHASARVDWGHAPSGKF